MNVLEMKCLRSLVGVINGIVRNEEIAKKNWNGKKVCEWCGSESVAMVCTRIGNG